MLVIVMTFCQVEGIIALTLSKLWVHVCTEKAMLSYTGHTGYEMTSLAVDASQLLLFPPVREFSTSQIAFQVTPLTAGTTSKTLYGITEHFIHEVLLLHPRIFLFLADIHLYVYIAPVPPLIVIGIYKLDETLVCTQGRVIVLA